MKIAGKHPKNLKTHTIKVYPKICAEFKEKDEKGTTANKQKTDVEGDSSRGLQTLRGFIDKQKGK